MYYTLRISQNDAFAIQTRKQSVHHVVAFRKAPDAYRIGRCLQHHLNVHGALPNMRELPPSGFVRMSDVEAPLEKIRIKRWDEEEDLLFFCSTYGLGVCVCASPKKSKRGFGLISEEVIVPPCYWTAVVLDSLLEQS